MARQVNSVTTHPPKTGAKAGDSEKILLTNASSLVAAAPSKQSRIMARPTTVPTPADMPCTTRNAVSQPTLGESAHPSAANPNASRFGEDYPSAPKSIRQGPMHQAHASKGEQVAGQRELQVSGACLKIALDIGEGRQVGIDRPRPEKAPAT